jgi:TRAP-type mannitol/chloroaromatic compound transport system permease large subunit
LSIKTAFRSVLAAILYAVLVVGSLQAQTITGKVVAVADGED